MNTYNHHRIIENAVDRINKKYHGMISDDDIKILKDASDFTDDFAGEAKLWKLTPTVLTQKEFFFYHFYYDIKCDDGMIILKRSNRASYSYKTSLEKCDYDEDEFLIKQIKYDESHIPYTDFKLNYKKFYITINDFNADSNGGRIQYYTNDIFDSSNQSDCVAFLHAMGSKDEDVQTSKNVYLEHLTKCLIEFLFIKDKKEAMFMLGIALHSLMDSFTPSHTGFQKYTKQDMAKHAQGDVIPFENDKVCFDPGQFGKDAVASCGKTALAAIKKGYNNDDRLNSTEYNMLKIFIDSYLDKDNDTDIKAIYDGSKDLSLFYSKDYTELNSRNRLNYILKDREYKENAYDYSNNAIEVVVNMFLEMLKSKQRCFNNYENYKEEKKNLLDVLTADLNVSSDGNNGVLDVFKDWNNKYNAIQFNEFHPASNEKLYKK